MIDSIEASQGATQRGTKIVKKGNELDKNSFLRILTAELTNQDPMNAKDSTAFVSQLAQFSSLEQMANLNGTMSLNSAGSLVGKTIALNSYDPYGHQYGGVVEGVSKTGDLIKLSVRVLKYKGDEAIGYESKEFQYGDLAGVLDVPSDDTKLLTFINSNLGFMLASALLDKTVEIPTGKGEEVATGKVKEVYNTPDGIKIKVDVNGEEKEYLYNQIQKVRNE